MYGAVNDRTPRGAIVTAVVAVALLAAILGGVVYYQTRQSRARDEADIPALGAELDRLGAAAASLRTMAAAADPATPPEEYAGLTRAAVETLTRYKAQARSTTLPSGRAWPGQFERADTELDEAFRYLNLVNTYLDRRKPGKGNRPGDIADADQNIRNMADRASEHLETVDGMLARMREQHDARSWDYAPARPGGASAGRQ
jgi:hypothetical protein